METFSDFATLDDAKFYLDQLLDSQENNSSVELWCEIEALKDYIQTLENIEP